MTKEELAWIVAVFDCEGCVDRFGKYTKKNGEASMYDYPRIQIPNTARDLLDRFHGTVGFGKIYGPYVKKSGKYIYVGKNKVTLYDYTGKIWWKWVAIRDDAEKFIKLIWEEWLSDKRREKIIKLGLAPSTIPLHNIQPHNMRLEERPIIQTLPPRIYKFKNRWFGKR